MANNSVTAAANADMVVVQFRQLRPIPALQARRCHSDLERVALRVGPSMSGLVVSLTTTVTGREQKRQVILLIKSIT